MMLSCPSRECKWWTEEDGCEFDGEITINPSKWEEIRCKSGYTPMKIVNGVRTNEINEELRKERLGIKG